MARARLLKPGFFTNDLLAEIEPLGRLLFSGLWCHVDREGRIEDRPRQIKALILPYDDCDCEQLLERLSEKGFINRYEACGIKVLEIPKFIEHQNPHPKEKASSLPSTAEPLKEISKNLKALKPRNRKEKEKEGIGSGSGSDQEGGVGEGAKDLQAPIVAGCEFVRATPEQLDIVKSKVPPDLYPICLQVVDSWLGGQTKAAVLAKSNPTHYRHLWAAWALDNASKLLRATGGGKQSKSVFEKNLELIAWAAEQDQLAAEGKL